MRVEVAKALDWAEKAGDLCTFDIEATGLKADYNSILVISVKPYKEDPQTFVVNRPGEDKQVLKDAVKLMSQFYIWVSYYGKGYDVPMIQGRLLRWKMPRLEKKHHFDLYFHLRSKIVTARRSMAHCSDWLDLDRKKFNVSAEVWNSVLAQPKKYLPVLKERCEADCAELEDLYDACKHLAWDLTL